MLAVIETGTIYNEISKNIIEFEASRGMTLAWCEDPIQYNHNFPEYDMETGEEIKSDIAEGWSRPITLEEKNEAVRKIRGLYLQSEADPLFFKYQRGEITEQEWLDKVQEIRDRFPYVVK